MRAWNEVDRTQVPDGGELRLMERGHEFSIMSGSIELMNSRRGRSEQQLAVLAAERVGAANRARVLIGGLGMGFTLRSALEHFPPDSEIVVAELVPADIAWARGPLADVHGQSLDDPRVTLVEGDVADQIRDGGAFDAILLDVDNGPDGLTRADNDGLYSPGGLAGAKAALRRGGILAIWSADPDARFLRLLNMSGFAAEEVRIRAGGARHVVWLGRRN